MSIYVSNTQMSVPRILVFRNQCLTEANHLPIICQPVEALAKPWQMVGKNHGFDIEQFYYFEAILHGHRIRLNVAKEVYVPKNKKKSKARPLLH